MKKGKKILIIVLAVIVFLALVGIIGWTSIPNKINENDKFTFNEMSTGGRVAIIRDNSEYKNELSRKIASELGLDIRTDGFGIEDIKEVDNSIYDAVVVMAPVYAGKLQNDAKRWIKNISATDNIILFITTGGLTEIDMDVDTVTSATPQMDSTKTLPIPIDEVLDMIIERIDKIIKN